jgi:hypothetical protein
LVIFEGTVHPGYGFFFPLLLAALAFFPETLLLKQWIGTPVVLSGVVLFTSFVVATLWALVVPDLGPARSDSDMEGIQARSALPPQHCPTCGLINTGFAEHCDCGYRFVA